MQPSQLRSGGGLRGWWRLAGRRQAKRKTKVNSSGLHRASIKAVKLVYFSWVLSVFVLFGVLAVCGAVLWCVWVSGPSRALPRVSWPPACFLVPSRVLVCLLSCCLGSRAASLSCWGFLLAPS